MARSDSDFCFGLNQESTRFPGFLLHCVLQYIPVVSAQGGGGSFNDRKPIGEFGCCEPRMTERTGWWIERWLECRAIYLCIYLCICLSIDLSIYLWHFWHSLAVYLSVYLFTSASTCICFWYRTSERPATVVMFCILRCKEHCVGCGGVGCGGIITSFALPHMWCNISVRSLALHSHPHMCHATLL